MTTTVKTVLSDGSTKIYTFEFDYLKKTFVKVLVEGVAVPFTVTAANQITLDTAPATGKVIIIKRVTDRTKLVDFVDGSVLLANDLNVAQLQAIHISAEALDAAGASLVVAEDGAYSANFRRISNVGDPEKDQDVVNKRWAETAMSSNLSQAITARTGAQGSETNAANSAASSASSASAAATSEVNAKTSETNAGNSASAAAASASSASTSKTDAASSASASSSSATAAANSATAAANSATAAATFEPSNYVKKAGDTITGNLVINGQVSGIFPGQAANIRNSLGKSAYIGDVHFITLVADPGSPTGVSLVLHNAINSHRAVFHASGWFAN